MKVYLDGERITPEGWIRCYRPFEVYKLLMTGDVTELSLDYDLGSGVRTTGYGVILWIEQRVYLNNFIPPKIHVHSANSSAKVRMLRVIESITRIYANK